MHENEFKIKIQQEETQLSSLKKEYDNCVAQVQNMKKEFEERRSELVYIDKVYKGKEEYLVPFLRASCHHVLLDIDIKLAELKGTVAQVDRSVQRERQVQESRLHSIRESSRRNEEASNQRMERLATAAMDKMAETSRIAVSELSGVAKKLSSRPSSVQNTYAPTLNIHSGNNTATRTSLDDHRQHLNFLSGRDDHSQHLSLSDEKQGHPLPIEDLLGVGMFGEFNDRRKVPKGSMPSIEELGQQSHEADEQAHESGEDGYETGARGSHTLDFS